MITGLSNCELLSIEKPARYLGGEPNSVEKKPDAKLSVCFAYPDIYELGMSNVAIKILYEILNNDPEIFADRVFSPWVDMEDLLRKKDLPLSSLEAAMPIRQFDVLAITLPYEMTFTNVLNLLHLSQIPLKWEERKSGPLIVGGGPAAANPLPLADFFDAILIGEGEEALPEMCKRLIELRQRYSDNEQIRDAISNIEGFWVPAFPKRVTRRIFNGFSSSAPPLKPVIPGVQVIHDRAPLEIFRGCTQGCRFCQAGFFYRPKRERKLEQLLEWADVLMKNTGEASLGLLSLSTSDYSQLNELVSKLDMQRTFPDQAFSLPSMRMNENTLRLFKNTSHIKLSGLTFAPEAGTQRMRDIINKKITELDIMNIIQASDSSIYRNVKLYFMIGLPYETDSDILGIADLIRKIHSACRNCRPRKTLSVSLSGFVPKPFTPFQWCTQQSPEALARSRRLICDKLDGTGIKISWRNEFLCKIEGILARGDRNIGKLLLSAFKYGCKFDGWQEKFSQNNWIKAFNDCGIRAEDCTGPRDPGTPLPWEFIDFKIPEGHLLSEFKSAGEIAHKDAYAV